jgi:hypothetical protein
VLQVPTCVVPHDAPEVERPHDAPSVSVVLFVTQAPLLQV